MFNLYQKSIYLILSFYNNIKVIINGKTNSSGVGGRNF